MTDPNNSPSSEAPSPAPDKPKRLPLRRIAAKLNSHLRLRKVGAFKFNVAGCLLDEALALGLAPDQEIPLADGRIVRVLDLYAKGNQAGGYKVFERFKVEEVDPAKEARRAARQGKGKEAPGA